MRKPMNLDLELKDENSTILLGNLLAKALPKQYAGILISLIGEMGAGKTTLVRALLRCLGYNGVVPSPTYTLVEPYELRNIFYSYKHANPRFRSRCTKGISKRN